MKVRLCNASSCPGACPSKPCVPGKDKDALNRFPPKTYIVGRLALDIVIMKAPANLSSCPSKAVRYINLILIMGRLLLLCRHGFTSNLMRSLGLFLPWAFPAAGTLPGLISEPQYWACGGGGLA